MVTKNFDYVESISDKEQLEIETLYGKSPSNDEINLDDCVEL
ncbi:MAG: hypothetical protein ACMXYB_05010 [Candidatus Woesearchaeota archaeon]